MLEQVIGLLAKQLTEDSTNNKNIFLSITSPLYYNNCYHKFGCKINYTPLGRR
jgi:hypothetical protein